MRTRSMVSLFGAVGLAAVACAGGLDGPSDPSHHRGGQVTVTRVTLQSGSPAESVTGVAAFFAPPGPADPATPWPAAGECVANGAIATPSPTAVSWYDAGETVTLRGSGSALVLDRFSTANEEILYLTKASADPAAIQAGARYDLEIDGSTGSTAVEASTVKNALEIPPAIGLYTPDLTGGPKELDRATLPIGWAPGNADEVVLIVLEVIGATESVTLRCGAADTGAFVVEAHQMNTLPAGSGRLTVSRSASTVSPLGPSTELAALAILVEGGLITLPE